MAGLLLKYHACENEVLNDAGEVLAVVPSSAPPGLAREIAVALNRPPSAKTRGQRIADGWRDGEYDGYDKLAAAIDAELAAAKAERGEGHGQD